MLQPQVVAIADGQAEERQQRHDPHQPLGPLLPAVDALGGERVARG